jgi:hypothetical protein
MNVFAAVAFDAVSNAAAGTGNFSFTHTPVGTPKAIILYVNQYNASSPSDDQISTVTYGGVAMTEMTGSPFMSTSTGSVIHAYHLGSSIPTGARTVSITATSNDNKRPFVISLTASADTEVNSVGLIGGAAIANPKITLPLNGISSFVSIGFISGAAAVSGITPYASWNSRLENDWGPDTAGWYTYNTIGTSDVVAGWTSTSDVATGITSAISEVAAGGGAAVVKRQSEIWFD